MPSGRYPLKKSKLKDWQKELLLVLLSTIMLAFVYSGHFAFLIVSLIPFLAVMPYTKTRKAVLYSAILSIFSFTGVYWLKEFSIKNCVIIFFFAFLFLLAFSLITNILTKKTKSHLLAVFIPALAWVILLQVYYFLLVGDYALELSQFYLLSAPLIWFIGGRGITFLIVLLGSCTARLIVKKEKEIMILFAILLLVFGCCFIFTKFSYANEGTSLRVAVVQGNIQKDAGWVSENIDEVFSIYMNLTNKALEYNPKLVVWPEGALYTDISKKFYLMNALQDFSNKTGVSIIAGSVTFLENGKKKNTVFIFAPDRSINRYDALRPFLLDKSFIKGSEKADFWVNNSRIGMIACYEEVEPYIPAEQASSGAEFFVSTANNHLFRNGRLQMASYLSRLRAMENYRYFVRAATTGISQIINPYGRIIASVPAEKEGFAVAEIKLIKRNTFYSVNGEIIIIAVELVLAAFLIKSSLPSSKKFKNVR